jgi:hypothetical protein
MVGFPGTSTVVFLPSNFPRSDSSGLVSVVTLSLFITEDSVKFSVLAGGRYPAITVFTSSGVICSSAYPFRSDFIFPVISFPT